MQTHGILNTQQMMKAIGEVKIPKPVETKNQKPVEVIKPPEKTPAPASTVVNLGTKPPVAIGYEKLSPKKMFG